MFYLGWACGQIRVWNWRKREWKMRGEKEGWIDWRERKLVVSIIWDPKKLFKQQIAATCLLIELSRGQKSRSKLTNQLPFEVAAKEFAFAFTSSSIYLYATPSRSFCPQNACSSLHSQTSEANTWDFLLASSPALLSAKSNYSLLFELQ